MVVLDEVTLAQAAHARQRQKERIFRPVADAPHAFLEETGDGRTLLGRFGR
jgi:hypothetical protein